MPNNREELLVTILRVVI